MSTGVTEYGIRFMAGTVLLNRLKGIFRTRRFVNELKVEAEFFFKTFNRTLNCNILAG